MTLVLDVTRDVTWGIDVCWLEMYCVSSTTTPVDSVCRTPIVGRILDNVHDLILGPSDKGVRKTIESKMRANGKVYMSQGESFFFTCLEHTNRGLFGWTYDEVHVDAKERVCPFRIEERGGCEPYLKNTSTKASPSTSRYRNLKRCSTTPQGCGWRRRRRGSPWRSGAGHFPRSPGRRGRSAGQGTSGQRRGRRTGWSREREVEENQRQRWNDRLKELEPKRIMTHYQRDKKDDKRRAAVLTHAGCARRACSCHFHWWSTWCHCWCPQWSW